LPIYARWPWLGTLSLSSQSGSHSSPKTLQTLTLTRPLLDNLDFPCYNLTWPGSAGLPKPEGFNAYLPGRLLAPARRHVTPATTARRPLQQPCSAPGPRRPDTLLLASTSAPTPTCLPTASPASSSCEAPVSFLRVTPRWLSMSSLRSTPATCPQTRQDARGASCAATSTKGPPRRTGPQNRRQGLRKPVADHAARGPDPNLMSFLRGPSTRSCRWGSVEFVNLVRQRTNLTPRATSVPMVWYA